MTGDLKKVAVLGASSHVARSLLPFFFSKTDAELFLFGRDGGKVRRTATIDTDNARVRIFNGFDGFESHKYDVCLNCVGAGTPNVLGDDRSRWFTLTESFDNRILSYLTEKSPDTLYVSFSSGAVYGNLRRAGKENSVLSLNVNHLNFSDFYILARLNAEAKHRSFENLRLMDIRLFSYFSRYLDENAGYFMSDVLKALLTKTALHTKPDDMVRDYIAPSDLFSLIMCGVQTTKINDTFDAYSQEPVFKSTVLNVFEEKFGLRCLTDGEPVSPNGEKNVYFSAYKKAQKIGYEPAYNSLETLIEETQKALEGR